MLREIERHTDNTQVKKEDSPKLSLWLRTGTSRWLKWSRMQKTSWIKIVSEKQKRSHALHLITLRTWCRPKSQGQGWQTSANQGVCIYICSSQWCSSQCTHSAWPLSKLQNPLQHWDLLQVPQTWMGIFWRRWREPQFEILVNFKVRKRWHFLFSCLTCILLNCQLPFPYYPSPMQEG